MGIYIDIFVLDYYDEKIYDKFWKYQHHYRWLWLTYWHACRQYTIWDVRDSFRLHDFKRIAIMFFDSSICKLVKNPCRYILKWFTSKIANSNFSDKLCVYSMLPSDNQIYGSSARRIYRAEWFREGIIMPFGKIEVRTPKAYDACLSMEYANWQKLPPPSHRISHHYHYFLDFKKGYTRKEIEKIKNDIK